MAVHLDPSPVESFVESLCNSVMDCGANQVDSPPQMFTKQLCPKLKSSIFMPKYSRLGCVSWPYSLTAKDGNTHGSYSCRIVLCSQPSDGKELCKPSRWTVVISTLIEKLQYQEYTVKDEFPATKRTIGTPSFALKMQCLSSSKKHGHVVGH